MKNFDCPLWGGRWLLIRDDSGGVVVSVGSMQPGDSLPCHENVSNLYGIAGSLTKVVKLVVIYRKAFTQGRAIDRVGSIDE